MLRGFGAGNQRGNRCRGFAGHLADRRSGTATAKRSKSPGRSHSSAAFLVGFAAFCIVPGIAISIIENVGIPIRPALACLKCYRIWRRHQLQENSGTGWRRAGRGHPMSNHSLLTGIDVPANMHRGIDRPNSLSCFVAARWPAATPHPRPARIAGQANRPAVAKAKGLACSA